ncbi:MAG: glycosyltransferase family 2 protein [Terracidiphilus sp.]|nr:glycosyltransferase family 2 protein [Terracidiphilus sp.]
MAVGKREEIEMTVEMPVDKGVKPLLTIAIPTYSRARYLDELLSTLFDQLITEPRVELIVSDNASPDETPNVVKQYVERGLQLRSIRNETNIGSDANFLQCFEQASGKYVWLLSDDDVLVSGAISKIMSCLEGEECDLVYVNSFMFNDQDRPKPASNCPKPERFVDPKSLARRVHVFFTFISGNIINKDRVQKVQHNPFSDLVGSNLVQLGWAYTALNGYVLGLYIHEKLVGMRVNNTGGYKLLEVFGPTFKKITDQWLCSKGVRKAVINGTIQRFWPGLILMHRTSADRFKDDADPREVLAPVYGNNIRYWICVYPAIVLPLVLAKFWTLAVRVLNRLDRAFGFVLLN